VSGADNLAVICERIVYTMWDTQHLTTLQISAASYGDRFTSYKLMMFVPHRKHLCVSAAYCEYSFTFYI
jgi:hypothetical protein